MLFPLLNQNLICLVALLITLTIIPCYTVGVIPCPKKCTPCVKESIACSDETNPRVTLPERLPMTVERLNMQNQPFSNPRIEASNFTQFAPPHISLRHLSIRHCNIKFVLPNTFSALTKLESIDLSANTNLSIGRDAFNGLQLRNLLIRSIGNLILNIHAFRGLEVTSLSLEKSGLNNLPYNLLVPLSNSLSKLFIQENSIKAIEPRLGLIFKNLEILDLTMNPLHCDCKLQWLIEMFKKRLKTDSKFNKQSLQSNDRRVPICQSPIHINHRLVHLVRKNELVCTLPQISLVDVQLQNLNKARLICFGRHKAIDAPLQISWITNDEMSSTKSYIKEKMSSQTLNIKPNNELSQYKCVINNSIGTVTASVKINWPSLPLNFGNRNKLASGVNDLPEDKSQKSWNNVFFDRRFTLLEILLAIGGTILFTGILFILLHKFFFIHCLDWEQRKKKQFEKCSIQSNVASVSLTTSCDPQIYSNSQTYDQPGLPYSGSTMYLTSGIPSSSCNNIHNPQQFYDFKNQRKIYRKL